MKRSEYYDSVQALNEYYPNGVPSKVLAYVKDESGEYGLYTSTNNYSSSGVVSEIGGYVVSEEEKEEAAENVIIIEDATEKSEEIIGDNIPEL